MYPSSLTENYKIGINDVDFSKRLKLSALSSFFQDIASIHAEKLGLGFDDIRLKANAVWALIRMKAEILKYPVWEEEITIKTWPQLPGRLEFERDFIITGQDGSTLVRAASLWVILDAETRKLKKPSDIVTEYPQIIKDRALASGPEKLKPMADCTEVYKRYIGVSDIDMNGHLNNSKYMDFITDCFLMDELKCYECTQIQINFLNEAFAGDTLTMVKAAVPGSKNKIQIEGLDQAKGCTVFRALLDIAPRRV